MKKYFKWLLIVVVIIGGVWMAHNKVYVTCENMCMEEGMTKEQILDTCVAKNRIAKVTGLLTVPAGSVSKWSDPITMPDGFTTSNSVVIAYSYGAYNSQNPNQIFKFFGDAQNSGEVIQGMMIRFLNDSMTTQLCIGTTKTSDMTYKYEIVLMRID